MTRTHADAGRERVPASRLGPVTELLADELAAGAGRVPLVLDCGGGSGGYAVPLAAAGCDVTVVDVSADALATLSRRAAEAGVSAAVHAVVGDVESLAALVAPGSVDAALAHGVLEAVDDVPAAFDGIVATVRPGGLVSVVVANPAAAVLGRALAGEPELALRELRELDAQPNRLGPDLVAALCAQRGLQVLARRGLGVFSDLVPGAAGDTPGAREALRALDREAAQRTPFAQIAGRVHLLARTPGP